MDVGNRKWKSKGTDGQWYKLYKACLRPQTLSSSHERPSASTLAGIENAMKAKVMLETLKVPGVKGAIPYFFQVEIFDLLMCVNLHHFIGETYMSQLSYITAVLRPEVGLCFYLILNNWRRAGKTFVNSAFYSVMMLYAFSGMTMRHFAGSEAQALVVLIYIRAILETVKNLDITETRLKYERSGCGKAVTIFAEAPTQKRRGETCDLVSIDEYNEITPEVYSQVLLGMTFATLVTMVMFSTRKKGAIGGVENLAEFYRGDRSPRILRYSCEDVCRWCVANAPIHKQRQCWHGLHFAGEAAKNDKQETIKNIIIAMGIDEAIFLQEGGNRMVDDAFKVFPSADMILRATTLRTGPFVNEPRIKTRFLGIDPNGGGPDTTGLCCIDLMTDGSYRFGGLGVHWIRSVTQELAPLCVAFVTALLETDREAEIVCICEAQPHGWAQHLYETMSHLRRVYFVCMSEADHANNGIGIPMGSIPSNKQTMAINASTVLDNILMSERPVLHTNSTNMMVKGEFVPRSSKDSFVIGKFARECKMAKTEVHPITGKITTGAKGDGTDDMFCAFLHACNAKYLLHNLEIYRLLLRPTFCGESRDYPPPLPPRGAVWSRLMGYS